MLGRAQTHRSITLRAHLRHMRWRHHGFKHDNPMVRQYLLHAYSLEP